MGLVLGGNPVKPGNIIQESQDTESERMQKVTSKNSMRTFTNIPDIDGLYWYIVPGKAPEPVFIDQARYGAGKFAGFNGRRQAWLGKEEYLIGPQLPPALEERE